jgi:hypothetical protein
MDPTTALTFDRDERVAAVFEDDGPTFHETVRRQQRHEALLHEARRRRAQSAAAVTRGRAPARSRPRSRARRGARTSRAGPSNSDGSEPEPGEARPDLTGGAS